MKKPLAPDGEVFYILSGPNMHVIDHRSVPHLLEAANRSLERGIEDPVIYAGERALYQDTVRRWLERICAGEPTEALIQDLNAIIGHIPYTHQLGQNEDGSPRWEHAARMDDPIDRRIHVAHGIAHFLASGGFRRLRRCQADGCGNFYLGPPQSKWCSTNCGGRERGRRKREKDRLQRLSD